MNKMKKTTEIATVAYKGEISMSSMPGMLVVGALVANGDSTGEPIGVVGALVPLTRQKSSKSETKLKVCPCSSTMFLMKSV